MFRLLPALFIACMPFPAFACDGPVPLQPDVTLDADTCDALEGLYLSPISGDATPNVDLEVRNDRATGHVTLGATFTPRPVQRNR